MKINRNEPKTSKSYEQIHALPGHFQCFAQRAFDGCACNSQHPSPRCLLCAWNAQCAGKIRPCDGQICAFGTEPRLRRMGAGSDGFCRVSEAPAGAERWRALPTSCYRHRAIRNACTLAYVWEHDPMDQYPGRFSFSRQSQGISSLRSSN